MLAWRLPKVSIIKDFVYCRREDVLSRLLWAFFLFLSVWRYKLDEWPMFRCDKVTGDMHCWYCNFQLTMCEVLLLNLQAINAIVMNHVNASLCDLQIRRMDILNLQIRRDYWEIILVSFLINFIFMHVLFLNIGILKLDETWKHRTWKKNAPSFPLFFSLQETFINATITYFVDLFGN